MHRFRLKNNTKKHSFLLLTALAFCAAHGEDWYWPSKKEMEDVFAAYNGTAFSSARGWRGR